MLGEDLHLHADAGSVERADDGLYSSCVDVPLPSVLILSEPESDSCLAGSCRSQNVDLADVFNTAHDVFVCLLGGSRRNFLRAATRRAVARDVRRASP